MRRTLVPELICSDIARTLAFYRDLLGFRVRYERPEDRFVFLELEGAELMIEQPLTTDRLWPRCEFSKPFGRGMNLELQVSDVGAIHASIIAAGLEIFLPLEERWYRRDAHEIGVRQFAVQDPDGYLIRPSQELGLRRLSS